MVKTISIPRKINAVLLNIKINRSRLIVCVDINWQQIGNKLFRLETPVFIIQWIMSFLTDRNQATKLGFHLSSKLPINWSIVQGSGIGPTLFIMFAYDLRPLDILNFLIKYADDATLLSPQNSETLVELEMAHIMNWATKNKMTLSAQDRGNCLPQT